MDNQTFRESSWTIEIKHIANTVIFYAVNFERDSPLIELFKINENNNVETVTGAKKFFEICYLDPYYLESIEWNSDGSINLNS